MELFFDLIFVTAVAQVSERLTSDYSIPELGRYALMFVLIWSAWCGQTYYSTRFSTDDWIHRVAVVGQCFIAAVMAANAKGALDSRDSAGFGAAYGALRFVLVLQYLRVRRIPRTKVLASRYALGYSMTAAVWIASALIQAPLRFWFWGAGMIVDFLTPLLVMHESRRIPPHGAHLPERFSLFVVIVLGEFVAEAMRGIESQESWTTEAFLTAIGSIAFAFLVASTYFDAAKGDRERHLNSRRAEVRFHIWNYSHLPLCLAIGTAGIGFEHAIASNGANAWMRFDAATLCLSVLVIVGALLGICERSAIVGRTLAGVPMSVLHVAMVIGFVVLALGGTIHHPLAAVCGALLLTAANLLVAHKRDPCGSNVRRVSSASTG